MKAYIKYGPQFLCIVAFLFVLFLTGCASVYENNQKQYLLGGSVMKGNKVIKNTEIDGLLLQKPNRRFLGLPIYPYLWLYQVGESMYSRDHFRYKLASLTSEYQQKSANPNLTPKQENTLRKRYTKRIEKARVSIEEGNWWMRVAGEPPVFYNHTITEKNATKIKGYLFNNGFYNAEVTVEADTLFQRIRPVYIIAENKPTQIENVQHSSRNTLIDSIINTQTQASLLRSKERYSGTAIEEERIRLETLLRNSGYYGFSRQNISFIVNDTLTRPTDSLFKSVDIRAVVIPPAHAKVFQLGDVTMEIQPTKGLSQELTTRDTTYWQRIRYIQSDKKYSPRILNSMIRLRPGDIYSQQNERFSQRQLSLTDQFQFINILFDTTGNTVNTHIDVMPLSKYEFSTDLGLNVIQAQAPGPFATVSYKIRNIFNGLENFEVNVRGGIEAVSGYSGRNLLYRSTELGFNSILTFPQLLVPMGKVRYKYGYMNPKTQMNLGYNFVNRPEYERTSIKSGVAYSLQPKTTTFYNLSLIDLSILNTRQINPDFQSLLDSLALQGNNLRNSFLRSFVSNVNFTFVHNTNPIFGTPANARYIRGVIESGGTSLNLFPGQMNQINKLFNPGSKDTLQFFKYVRWNIDYRKYWKLNSNTSLVGRINSGGVHSYGGNERGISGVPPYEKYFFAGGSNSVRAWLPRRLGPGSTRPRYTANNLSIESPGEFLLEGNLELRGHLMNFFGKINYALFLDVGNVWNLSGAPDDPGRFAWNRFAKEIAVGTGVGLRYDLSFVVIRFDFGAKVYDPYSQKFVLHELEFGKLFNARQANFLNLNIGVGYPF